MKVETAHAKANPRTLTLTLTKVMKVETAHAKALFRVADATHDGFLEYREFLGLMAILYRHFTIRGSGALSHAQPVSPYSQRPQPNSTAALSLPPSRFLEAMEIQDIDRAPAGCAFYEQVRRT